METYEQLREKMIQAFGYKRTEEIAAMARKEVKRFTENFDKNEKRKYGDKTHENNR